MIRIIGFLGKYVYICTIINLYMTSHNPKTYKDAGFSFEEIQRIKSSVVQADTGMLIPESEVWERVSHNRKTYV